MLNRVMTFIRSQAVLCIAFACACISIVLAGDIASIPAYIDWRVVALLFCLMAAVAGLQRSGLMGHIARGLVRGRHSQRAVCFTLVMLPFFVRFERRAPSSRELVTLAVMSASDLAILNC